MLAGNHHAIRLSSDLSGATAAEPEELVAVLAGTAMSPDQSNGNTLPQVKLPWGFNDWVPQTRSGANSMFFHTADTTFHGMRCTHQPSPWIADYGYFLLVPHMMEDITPLRYNVFGSKVTFRPYLFKAQLQQTQGAMAFELTPTSHAALVRVTFPPQIMIGFLSVQGFLQVSRVDGPTFRGSTSINSGGVPVNWKMHLVLQARNSSAFSARWEGTTLQIKRRSMLSAMLPLVLELEVATSFISSKQADLNLQQEVTHWSFNELMAQGKAAWHKALGRVKATAIDQVQLQIFYTNLWKAMLFPRFLQEKNAEGRDVHFSPYTGMVHSGRLVADSGFWDAYHTVYPLQSIVFPDILGNQIDGWLSAYKEAGWLPTWASPGQRGSMAGTMGDATLADAIVKSRLGLLHGFDVQVAYAAIRRDAFEIAPAGFGRAGLEHYARKGYFAEETPFWDMPAAAMKTADTETVATPEPAAEEAEGQQEMPLLRKDRSPSYPSNPGRRVSTVLRQAKRHELVYDAGSETASTSLLSYTADAAMARAAMVLGRTVDAQVLWARSRRYSVLFNSSSGFFQPRSASGNFLRDFGARAWRGGFTEGSAWHYRFMVPHDVDGLNKLHGGHLCDRIEEMLTSRRPPAFQVGGYDGIIHEMVEAKAVQDNFGLYNHCNQPVHEVLWVAKKAGCNALADRYLRKVMDLLYTANGWCGDEDNGEMAAWYVLSSLGLYALEPGKDELVLGSPALVSARVELPGGRQLSIFAENQGRSNVHVRYVTWKPAGGFPRRVIGNVLKYSELMAGGELRFTMGP